MLTNTGLRQSVGVSYFFPLIKDEQSIYRLLLTHFSRAELYLVGILAFRHTKEISLSLLKKIKLKFLYNFLYFTPTQFRIESKGVLSATVVILFLNFKFTTLLSIFLILKLYNSNTNSKAILKKLFCSLVTGRIFNDQTKTSCFVVIC